ncbi:hypothetical protein PRIC1_000156 [Phytophthora ramorum]|uniref:Uncharacterized protein n=1 Tax=Phytophthora ramorum TaxID=164328 RepID=H3GDZ5_PHYRM|nr:hypothetical protein KRP23_10788 [Phytophthora ramorum]KAH7497042.1 hypothetical protein KRP22_13594 [Phytophthora ramorum]
MATIYSGAPSSRFPFSAHTHYTSNADAAAQIQLQHLRYGGGYALENQMEVSSPPSLAPPGATLGLLSKHQHMYAESSAMRLSSPVYSSNQSAMYMQSMMSKMYQPHPPPMDMPQHQQQTDVLLVSPGVPTPVELSIYEVKQPTGFLHVTVGNQTVEFLDGVANMPQKR